MRCGTHVWLLVCWVAGLSDAHITLESSPASVRLAAPRSRNLPIHLQVDAFNQQHQLTLSPASSPFAPNFKLQTTTRDHQGRLLLEEVEDTDNDLSTIYHDPHTGAVVSVDGSSVEGLLTPTLSIKPSADGEHQAIRHQTVDPANYINDYVELPHHLRVNHENRIAPRGVVSVTPELYIIVDSTLASVLGSDSNIKKYLGIFYNAVNHRFATMSDPKVQVVLAGVLIVRNSADEPYINDNALDEKHIKVEGTLNSVSEWLYLQGSHLPDYDIAYLMTGKDLAGIEDGALVASVTGRAWRAAACLVSDNYRKSFNTAIGEDEPTYFGGVLTATHELAHNLGSPHDSKDGPEACSWARGYIMSYVTGKRNKFYFSSCSQQFMKTYITSPQGSCLLNLSVGATIPISGQLPGLLISADEQCRKITGISRAFASKSESDDALCRHLMCQWIEKKGNALYRYTSTTGRPAAEGTPCRGGGVCMNGICQ